jgi:prevent-host-death family protein
MAQFNIADAKAHFSELVKKALLGEEVIIAKDKKPLVKLVPLNTPNQARKAGSAKGQIWMASDFSQTPKDFEEYL